MREIDTHIYFFTKEDIFSNFATTPFIYEKKIKDIFGERTDKYYLDCSEQGYMFEKCLYFGQLEMAQKCIETRNPKEVKNIGRSIPNFNAEIWNKVSFDKMYNVLMSKYTSNQESKISLIKSGNKTLVEASPYDLVWGVGLSKYNDDILQEEYWRGENRLGNVLMKVRKDIKKI